MRRIEQVLTFLSDAVTMNAAFAVYYLFRVETGWFAYAIQPEFFLPLGALYIYWLAWFGFAGLYRSWYLESRLDEIFLTFRVTILGCLVLFFLIALDDSGTGSPASSRYLIIGYWVTLFPAVVAGRFAVRMVQRRLLLSGVGRRPTLIIGWGPKAYEMCDMVFRSPALGYDLRGFVSPGPARKHKGKAAADTYRDLPLVGSADELRAIVSENGIKEVLVALESREHGFLIEVMKACEDRDVGIKILADLYDIVSGQARVHSIYGLPLLEVHPRIMQPWEEAAKRSLDILVSLGVLVLGAPVWVLAAVAIKLDSRGPVFYLQTRVGRFGQEFQIVKFRSMYADSERASGPVWAGKNDPRVTRVGRLLRRTHLDEVPQFWNVLVGHMSLVGPRPERPYFVQQLQKEIPLYVRRLRVRPGITGWAQVKHKYDESFDDVREKIKYDLFYIENASWRFDMKILLNTLYVMLMRKGHS